MRKMLNTKVTSHRPLIGHIIVWFRQLFRKEVERTVAPLASSVRELEYSALNLERTVASLRQDISKLEMHKLDQYPELGINTSYFGDVFRGPKKEITSRQKKYVKYFKDTELVVDLGCGRGEFLELLKKNGIPALGVDTGAELVGQIRKKGFTVKHMDIMSYLRSVEDQSIDGIFCAHVIEHLHMKDLVLFLKLCYQKLSRDGKMILETPNILCAKSYFNYFYLDPTHIRPVHPDFLQVLLDNLGFKDIKVGYVGKMSAKKTKERTEFADFYVVVTK